MTKVVGAGTVSDTKPLTGGTYTNVGTSGINPLSFLNSIIPGADVLTGGLIGALGGFLNKGNALGNTGYGVNRLEDPITTRALAQMDVNRDRMMNQNPEAQRKMTEGRLMGNQAAAMAAGLGASAGMNANANLGGDAAMPMAGALRNNAAAMTAAAPYAQAMAQNDQAAMQNRMAQDQSLQQLSNEYGNQAAHVNLIAASNAQPNDLSSRIRRSLLGLNEGATIFGNLADSKKGSATLKTEEIS